MLGFCDEPLQILDATRGEIGHCWIQIPRYQCRGDGKHDIYLEGIRAIFFCSGPSEGILMSKHRRVPVKMQQGILLRHHFHVMFDHRPLSGGGDKRMELSLA